MSDVKVEHKTGMTRAEAAEWVVARTARKNGAAGT